MRRVTGEYWHMKFPENYLEDEIRDGFYVSGMMKRCWAAQLVCLEDFRKFCEDIGVRWYAAYGTLLGAVRHKGYIPWDDDLDVWMMRGDYEKFLRNVNMMPDSVTFMEGRFGLKDKSGFDQPFGRIINSMYFKWSEEFLRKYDGFPYPTGLDIFVLDKLSPDPEEEQERLTVNRFVSETIGELNDGNTNISGRLDQIEAWTGIAIDRSDNLLQQLVQIYEGLNCLFEDQDSGYVTAMHDWIPYENYRFSAEWFSDTVELPFETTSVAAPVDYDQILKSWCGDYMKPDQRGTHNYPFFRQTERDIESAMGELPYKYYFHPECLNEGKRTERKEIIKEMKETFEESCDKAIVMLRYFNGCTHEMLVRQSDSVLYVTKKLEQTLRENYPDICSGLRCLFERCYQDLNRFHQVSTEPEPPKKHCGIRFGELAKEIQSIKAEIAGRIESDIIKPVEVVFLPFKAEGWENLKPLYDHFSKKTDVRVYVCPISYYRRNVYFDLEKKAVYEGEKIAEKVPVVPWKTMNLSVHTPDIIVSQNPYDQFGMGFSVDPSFYSGELQKCSHQVVYVPWFRTEEVVPEHQAAYKAADAYIDVPGVVAADRVIVPSVNTRNLYIEKLSEFAGEDTRIRWKKTVQYAATAEDLRMLFEP